MKNLKYLALAILAIPAMGSAVSITMATFDDPSLNSANPLFTFDMGANTLSGSWTQPGLNLQTPGFTGGGSLPNSTFVFSPVSLALIVPGVYSTSGGTVQFLDSANNPSFLITFSSGLFVDGGGAGASEFRGDNIAFSGPNVPLGLTDELFNFSFANQVTVANTKTYTAAFTSSAAVPEPATLLILGSGIATLAARRRRRA